MKTSEPFNILADIPTANLLAAIEMNQAVQKRHPPTHPAWQNASCAMAPLIEEMARRQKLAKVQS